MTRNGITPTFKIGGCGACRAIGNSRRARGEGPSIAATRVVLGRIANGSARPCSHVVVMAWQMNRRVDSVACRLAHHAVPTIA